MSFRIFILQLTGRMKSAEKVEADRAALEKKYAAFLKAESSEKLALYRDLESWVSSGAMQQRKKELESEIFKGSSEYNLLKEFEALKKTKAIRNYFKIEGSPDLQRFLKIKDSELLKEYYDLKDFVDSGAFEQVKRELSQLNFKDSVECRHLKELAHLKKNKALQAFLALKNSASLEKHRKFLESTKLHRFLELKNTPSSDKEHARELKNLKKDPEIKNYFRFENSKELKYYNEMTGSHVPDRFEELQQLTGTREFNERVAYLKDGKKLEKSEAWKKFQRFKSLSSGNDIRFFLKFEKSSPYIDYLDTKESFALKRYRELLEITTSADFLKRKAWLEDTKKWEKSEEHAKYEQYLSLKKDPEVDLYFRYAGKPDFDELKNWELTFSDEFQSKSPDFEKWTPNSYWADRLLGDNFSQSGDLQAYTGGKNTAVSHGKLHVYVRKEKFRSKLWQPGAGFVPIDFSYTSDTLSTIKSFWQQGGAFEAKIMFAPVSEVVSTCYLRGEKNSPLVTLVEMGRNSRMGILSGNGTEKLTFDGIHLNRLKKNRFHIFRLEWEKNHLVWKINDTVVHESEVYGLDEPAHLNLTSLVLSEIAGSHLPVNFETAWIRCYRKK